MTTPLSLKSVKTLIQAGSFFLLLLFYSPLSAQTDSASANRVIPRIHSPRKATLLSTVLPGAGQVYNRQVWKVPVVYLAIGIPAYMSRQNVREFKRFKQAYLFASEGVGSMPAGLEQYDKDVLREGIEVYRRNRDWSYFFTGLAYVLNIIDATVYAHLFDFDVNENISLNIQPYNNYSAQPAYGLRLVMNF